MKLNKYIFATMEKREIKTIKMSEMFPTLLLQSVI